MLDVDQLRQFAIKNQTLEINVLREYCQHLFLSYFYKLGDDTNQILFKGGTALRIVFQSPRYSEDLDFSANKVYMMDSLLEGLEKGVAEENIIASISDNSATSGGYIAFVTFDLPGFTDHPKIKINVQQKEVVLQSRSIVVQNQFVPPYHLLYLTDEVMVQEKIQAFQTRVKARDFFDLYYMLGNDQLRGYVVKTAKLFKANILEQLDRLSDQELKNELSNFLPVSYRNLYTGSGFRETLRKQIERYVIL